MLGTRVTLGLALRGRVRLYMNRPGSFFVSIPRRRLWAISSLAVLAVSIRMLVLCNRLLRLINLVLILLIVLVRW